MTGKTIWAGLQSVWHNYTDGFHGGLMLKIVWLLLGLPIEIIKHLFIYTVVFFMLIFNCLC